MHGFESRGGPLKSPDEFSSASGSSKRTSSTPHMPEVCPVSEFTPGVCPGGSGPRSSHKPLPSVGGGCALCVPETHVAWCVGVGTRLAGCSQQGALLPTGQGHDSQAHVQLSHCRFALHFAQHAAALSSAVGWFGRFRPPPMLL